MSLSLATLGALFVAMVLLAAVPGVSVLVVTARVAAGGFRHGVAATVGIVAGDLLFIAIAVAGLSLLADLSAQWFGWLRLLAAGWLIWLGVMLMRAAFGAGQAALSARTGSRRGSFMAGLLLTLGDQKALLFYFAFFPAFVEPAVVSVADMLAVMLTAMIAVGGVKLVYALLAARAGAFAGPGAYRMLHFIAGLLLLVVAGYLLITA